MAFFEVADAQGDTTAHKTTPFHKQLEGMGPNTYTVADAQTGEGKKKPDVHWQNEPQGQASDEKLSPAMQKTKDAADAFVKEPDKSKALKDQSKNFESAISMADQAYVDAAKIADAALAKMKRKLRRRKRILNRPSNKQRPPSTPWFSKAPMVSLCRWTSRRIFKAR